MKKTMWRAVFAVAGILVLVAVGVAQEKPAKVAGKWEMTREGPRGTMTVTFSFEQDGEKLKGTVSGPGGRETPLTGTVKGNKVTFSYTVQTPNGERSVEYLGTVEGDTMKGTTETPRGTREWTAKKVKGEAQRPGMSRVSPVQPGAGADLPWIDTHTHPLGGPGRRGENVFSPERLDQVLAIHDRWGVRKALLALPPSPRENQALERQLAEAAKSRRDRLGFLGGGLQALIEEAVKDGKVSEELQRRFEAKAAEHARAGAAGFGEMTALHFSFRENHPYVEAAPDHPLFLLLTDLAAQHNVVIDLHVEAVAKATDTPPRLLRVSPLNPPTVRENISALEQLLAHKRNARIVWAHIGWDNTGHMTVDLLRRLLVAHANLFLQIRIPTVPGTFPENNPLDAEGQIRAEWLDLIRAFPDRFVLGSDAFMARPDFEQSVGLTASLLQQLPAELARKVGYENAQRIYRLK